MKRRCDLATVVLLALSAVGCQQGPPSSPTAEAEYLVQELFAAWNEHEPERLDLIFTDGGVYEDVAAGKVFTGHDEIKGYLNSVFAWAPDFTVSLDLLAVAGGTVAVEWTMEGTQTGPMGAIPATGKRFSVRGVSVIQLEDGRIRRNSDYYDGATFFRQIGGELRPPGM
jgi:steroid delta-isomerase-like uncharacterized protein